MRAEQPRNLSAWEQLIEVHLRATVRASVPMPPVMADRSRWRIVDTAVERLVVGEVDEIDLDEDALALFTSLPVGERVYYGWPVVVVADRRGARHLAPVLMTPIIRPDGSTRRVLADEDEPYLNPGLFSEDHFPAEVLAALDPLLSAPLPFSDASAMAERVGEVMRVVGLPGAVDPSVVHLSAPSNLGVHNVCMVFRGRSALATAALVDELTTLRSRTDWEGTAAAALLAAPTETTHPGIPPATDFTAGLPPLSVRALRLNDSQERALTGATTAPVTVVTGPPGTGKSQLVAGIVANQWLAGRSVLVASTNNTPVDVAAERAASIDPALVIRTGNSKYREAMTTNLARLKDRHHVPGMSSEIIRRRLEVAASTRLEITAGFVARAAAESDLAQNLRDLEGLRILLWGSPTREPDPAARRRLHALASRHTGRWFRRRRERRMLELAAPTIPGVVATDVLRWADLDASGAELTTAVTALGVADPDADRAALAAADGAWSEAGNDALKSILDVGITAAQPYIHQMSEARSQVAAGALRTTITRSVDLLKGWACTTLAAKGNFDLAPGMFDLLVVDEASQCSIAHILPLAYRARRIVVVGDPNQLSPIVSIDRSHVEQIATACGTSETALRASHVSASADSVFSAYAARVPHVHLLDEHYRCHPEIAAFINTHFYGGALRVLTDVTVDRGEPRGLSFIDVRGRTERAGSPGTAASGATNTAEIDAIVAWVLAHPLDGARLGIVTPFAAQVTKIDEALRRALGESEFAAADITIGTAHAFQGGERDIVLFSLVLATDAPAGTAAWVESQRNLINVAVSRAKRALIVVGDRDAVRELPVPTLHALVHAAQNHDAADHQPTSAELAEVGDLHSDSERRLYAALRRAGYTVHLKPVVEGYELDLTVETPDGLLNIEVDGSHHVDDRGRQRRQDLARDAILSKLGVRVLRIPAWRCLAHPDHVVRENLP